MAYYTQTQTKSQSTPEEYLARTIRREIRKEDHDEYKRKTQEHHGYPVHHIHHGAHLESALIMSPSGTLRHGYVVTTPGATVVQTAPFIGRVVPTSSQSYGTQSWGSMQAQASTQREYYTSVPAELAARGIKPVVEKPHVKNSGREHCRVPGCRIEHSEHFCNVCSMMNVSHPEEDCPRYKARRY